MRGLDEARAVGSSYPLWYRWPGADGAAPPGGEKRRQGSVFSHLQLALCRKLAQRTPGKESMVAGSICFVRTKYLPLSQPLPPIVLRDLFFYLTSRRST